MAENNFIIELIARLNKLGSKKQIRTDAKNIGEIKIPLIGTLDKRRTKQQIKQDLSSINETVNLNGKVNKKGIVSSVQQATQQAQKKVNSQPVEINFSVKKEKLINDIKLLGQQNSRLFKDTGMTSKFNTLLDNAQLATNTQELNSLRLQLGAFRSELKVTGNIGMTFTDALKSGLSKVLQLFGGYNVIMQFTAQLRNAWKEAKELDSALTDLSRVNSEISRSDFPNYLDKIINKTKELSVATKDYIDAVTTFSRAGYNLTDSEILADAAMQLEKVGDMSSESASKALLSGLQGYAEIDGYGMDQLAEKAQALNDKIDIIGNTASISQKEVAEGIQAVGSVMADANTSVDEFISLLGAANRTVQDSNKVALAIRTSALRIRGCTVELEEMGETTDGVIESTSTLATKIKALTNINGSGGVDILEADEETFRSIYDIYNDIAKVYDKMSDKNAAALLELIAGKNRSNQISAVLNNMSEANELLDRSLNAAGTASNEYQIYLDSAEAATERFGVAMTETYNNILNGETVKSLANAGIAVLDFANNFGIVEGTIKGFLALGILKGITTLTMAFKNSAVQVNNYGKALTAIKDISVMTAGSMEYAESMNILKTSCIGLTEVRLKQVLANKALGESERVAILMERGLTQEQAQAKLVQMGLTQTTNAQTTANGAATASTFSLKAAITGLGASIKTAFLSNPVGIAIMAISTAIGFATSALSKHNQAVEELRQRTKEAADNANILSNEVSELTNKYISLSEAVKTDTSVKEDLITTQTELLKKLGLEGENIDDLTSKYGSLSNAIKQASIDSLKNSQIDLIAGVDSAREELLEVAKDNFWGTNNIINATGEDAVKAFKELEKAGIISDGSYGSAGGSLVLIGDKTIDGALENFTKLEDALTALRDSKAFTTEELSENSLYQAVYNRYSGMKNGVDYYRSAIENLNENLSQQTMLIALQGQEIPKTEKAFNIFRQELVNTAIASNQFIGNEKEITDAINSYLSTVPEFEGYYSIPLKNELDKVNELLGQENLSTSLSITDTIDQINTQLKPAFDSLKSAYQNIFTYDKSGKKSFSLDNLGIDTFESIRAELEKLGEIDGITVDYTPFERFVSVLSDTSSTADEVQAQFDNLATSIIYTTDCTNISAETYDLLVQSLTEMGVTNAEEVLYNLKGIQEELVASGYDVANITSQEAGELINLGSVSAQTTEYLRSYLFQKELAQNPLNTISDITALENLCNSLGVTGKLYEYVIDLKRAFDAKEHGAVSEGLDQSIEHIKGKIASLSNGQADFKFKFSKPDTSKKSSSKSEKDTNKEFDWIERAIENAEKEVKKLEDIVNSAYSTFFEKSKALAQEIEKVNEEIGLQQQAYDEYMRKAESIGLSDDYKALVRDGAIQIDDISDEKLQAAITDYQKWYEKAVSVSDKITELQEKVKDLNAKDYEQQSDSLQRSQEKNLITMTEYYRSMMALQDKYYNNEATKLKDLANKMQTEYGRMNSMKLTRDSVDASTIQAAGYATALQSSSVYAQSFGNETKQVVVTPILPDGTILSPNTLAEYANRLLNGEQIDADIELAVFEGNDAAIQTANYMNGLEMMQTEYQNLKKTFSENLYDNFTEKQLEAIEKLTEEIEKHKSQLSSELGDIKSAYDDLKEIRDTYNKYGKISVDQYQSLCDMGFEYLALLSDESGALSLDEDAFQRLTDAKIQQIQVDMALQAADLIKNIQTEEQAVQYLAASYENLASNALSAAEEMLYAAQANAQLIYGVDSLQAKAANTIVKGYENSKLLAGNIDIKMKSGGGYEDKEEKADEIDWGEKILDSVDRGLEKTERIVEKISDKTDKLIDKAEKFFSWQKKNAMINRAVKSSDKEIKANEKEISKLLSAVKRVQSVSNLYSQKLNSIDLSGEYKNKIQNGTLEIESITDESLKNTISEYEKWYDKLNNCKDKMEEYNDAIQECRDSVSELYEQQRDLIKQKLENVLSYYSDMDSYLSSITSKIESLISLNDEMGKRSSLTELVEQFASFSDQINSTTQKEITPGVIVTEGSLGDSKKVADAVNRDRQELADSIQKQIDNLNVDQSGTYTKLLKDIAKTEAQIDKYIDKGWDVKKAKQFEKLTQKLQNYYDLQNELDQNTTSNTVGNYSKIYTAYQKLKNKIESGKDLNKSEQKKFDSYEKQLADLKNKGQNSLDKLYGQLAEANGTAPKKSEADKIKEDISEIHSDVKNSATYQNLLKDIEKVEDKLAKLDEKGYDNLSKSQKKTYDKLQSQLEGYYEQKESLDQNATAANIAEYNKIYLAWKKLQNKIDKGGNLSVNDWKKYNTYTEQLENYAKEKAETLDKLNDDLAEALDPSDKLETIQKTYEESAEGIYESYQNQIKSINGEAINTQQYQNLYAKAQKLEQKKNTKGLSKSEQAQLDKYNAELEALQKGAMGTNISEYMKTWESLYKLQQKLDKNGKLSANEAKNYDTYKAQLEAWNNAKQTQIQDLLSQMEDDLAQLQQTHTENVSEAESQVSDYYANLYQLAKQIAEYNTTTLKAQLECLDSMIGYYKELVSLYDTFSGEKLTKLLTDLDENVVKSKVEVYSEYLDTLQNKYNTTLSEMNEYQQLLDALDTNDFQSSMDLFDKAMESYKASGDIVMADKLQSVLDLLNERAIDADNWGEFADKWAEEWTKEFSSAKQEVIGTANEIQKVSDALRNAKFENITNAISDLDTTKEILSSITNLIQDEWLYDQGELSEYGQAKVALLVSQLEDAQKKANAYLDLYNEIQNNKDTYASDKAYMEDLNNALQNYYNTLGESATLENSILELMRKSAQEELDNLKSIIEARKKALQKKKEYYDYDRNIRNQTRDVDSLKAQIKAIESLTGVTDAATKAKLAQLKADLAEKEDSLQETKDEHTYNLQIDALDEFAASLEDALDNSTKSLAEIMKEYENGIKEATDIYKTSIDSVNGTLDKIKELYGGTGTITGNTTIDLTPKDTENNKANNTIPSINITPSTDSNETPNTVAGDVDDVDLIIKQNMIKAAELFEKYGAELTSPERLFKVNDQQMFELVNRQFSVMADVGQNVPNYIKNNNVQPVVNIHYDNMINVEGSVDKSFSKEFKKDSDEIYDGIVRRLTRDLKKHINVPIRPSLPSNQQIFNMRNTTL